MKPKTVDDLFSKASEAIVSHDGRIKRKIHNYETVIGEAPDDPLYIPSGAVNDNYGNLPNQITIAGIPFLKISVLRYVMFSIVAVVLFVFAWSLLSLVYPYRESLNKPVITTQDSPADPDSRTELQLEKIANLIIQDGNWDKSRIEIFLKEWDASSPEDKNKYGDNAWLQHFNYRLKAKYHEEKNIGAFTRYSNSTEIHPIMALAFAMGVAEADIKEAAIEKRGSDLNEIAEEVSTELAKLEQEKKSSPSNTVQTGPDNDDVKLNSLLMQNLGITSEQEIRVTPGSEAKTADLPVENAPGSNEPGISGDDVKQVLEKYTAAYEKGDMDELTSLFGLSNPSENELMLTQLKNNFEFIFSNSDKRNVRFNGINWRLQGDRAEVSSDYFADIALKNNKGKQSVTANAKVKMELLQNKLYITSFSLLDRNVNVTTPEISLKSVEKVIRPDAPTAAELQDVVTKLIVAYENGDIEKLTSLFAKDAKTNDRNDIKGIENDYKSLFASTNDRQMFIQNLQWSQDRNYAKGSGDLEAIVLTGTDQSVYTMKGKIQIVTQRINDKVLITHLYHIERSN